MFDVPRGTRGAIAARRLTLEPIPGPSPPANTHVALTLALPQPSHPWRRRPPPADACRGCDGRPIPLDVTLTFAGRVAIGTARAVRFPSVWGPAAVAAIGLHAGLRLLSVGPEFWLTQANLLAPVAILLLAWAWLGLATSATAIAVLRDRGRWRPTVWIPAPRAFQVGAVYVAIIAPIMAGLVFLVVPGIVLAIWWSQAGMLVLDGQAEWLDALPESQRLTAGRRFAILVSWLMIGAALAVVEGAAQAIGAVASELSKEPTPAMRQGSQGACWAISLAS